jgi:phage terminase large subunit
MAIFLARNYKAKFLCTRQFQNRIEDSVYTLLKAKIEEAGLRSDFQILKSSIICPETGSEFLFYGRARNIEEIKGTEGVDIHWAEECELLTKEEWRTIDPTLRVEGAQHWLIFNPKYATDFAYQRFVVDPPPKTIVRHINYNENPFLSQTMLDVIEAARLEDEDEFRHVYLGEPLSDEDRVVIQRKWIEAAIDAHIKLGFSPSGQKVVGFDVADDGDDKCAAVSAHGSLVYGAEEWKGGEDELMQSCSRVWNLADATGSMAVYDCIGVGAGVGSKFNELNEARGRTIRHSGFNAGGAVFEPKRDYMPGKSNEDQFSNIKAQAWWMLADRFRNTYNAVTKGQQFSEDQMISISSGLPHLKKLVTELSTPKREFDGNGRVKVESKKDLAKRNVVSPNIADALVMCFAPKTMPIRINRAAIANAMRRG